MELKNFIEALGFDENMMGSIMAMAKPLLGNFLKIDQEAFDTLFAIMPKFLAGEIDFKRLLTVALPVALSYFSSIQKPPTEQICSGGGEAQEELSEDLKEISPEAFSQLSVFLQNDNASR